MKRLGFAPTARADLLAIGLYIAEDNPERVESFVAERRAKAVQAAERSRSFPAHDDVSQGSERPCMVDTCCFSANLRTKFESFA